MFWGHYKENAHKYPFFSSKTRRYKKPKTSKAFLHTIQKISPEYLWIYLWITFIHSFSRLRKGHYIKEYTSKK